MSARRIRDVALVEQLCIEVGALAARVRADLGETDRIPGSTIRSAAMRRRSMDLTRALAQLRKP